MRDALPSPALRALRVLLALAALVPTTVRAQRIEVELTAGLAPVVGGYHRTLDVGPSLNVGVGVPLRGALALRADASLSEVLLLGDGRVDSYVAGVGVRVLDARIGRVPLRADLRVEGGASRLRFDAVRSWHPSAAGGVALSAAVTARVALRAEGRVVSTFLGDRRTVMRVATDAGGTLTQLPLRVGIGVRL